MAEERKEIQGDSFMVAANEEEVLITFDLVDISLSHERAKVLAETILGAFRLWKEPPPEEVAQLCTRHLGHKGPCNGFPRQECIRGKTLDFLIGQVK